MAKPTTITLSKEEMERFGLDRYEAVDVEVSNGAIQVFGWGVGGFLRLSVHVSSEGELCTDEESDYFYTGDIIRLWRRLTSEVEVKK